ncbi:MAG: Cytosol aminopeptidase PepA [Burkholderiaceae bacterium]|jgi:leucyl aminopeptidase|nr:MAG: Cytosol aminopeptidase PepA [Burkholderiaceae bacterium]
MNFELKTLGLADAATEKCDALIVLVPQGFVAGRDALSQWIADALKTGDLEPGPGKLLTHYRCAAATATRLVLAGVGDGSAREVRKAVEAAMGALKDGPTRRLCLCFAAKPEAVCGPAVRAALLATADASYRYTTTKSKAEGRKLARVTLGMPEVGAGAGVALKKAFDQGVATIAGIELAKEWGNRPANHATPSMLADAARALAKLPRIRCEVLGPREVERLGMGALLAVAQGSREPLRFIVLKYQGAAKATPPVVLVGKGITFDSGGISIKPAPEMDEMKFDMCGAASVLGAFRALGELQPALNVVGLIPSSENLPGGSAVKPGDVVTSLSGQTIEILNTDAEGRLILCDALAYAERFKPRAVIDIATLTGACIIALGHLRSALYATDEDLAQALQASGEAALDPCWRMPLDDDYAEGLKTHFADVANVAGRPGGSITAAKFLQRFATAYPWAHLDIAGIAWKSGAAKGATGRPVGLLLDYLLNQEEKVAKAKSLPSKVASKRIAIRS